MAQAPTSESAIRQGTPEWHAWRREGIGGSDAPIVTGDAPWGSRYRLWAEKLGEADPEPPTARMRLGNLAEPLIADLYAERTGRELSVADTLRVHPENRWMRASIDRWAGERIVECKLSDSSDWGHEGTDEVPAHVMVQVQHQLAVTGAPVADVAHLPSRGDLRVYTIEPDARLIDLLIAEEEAFWAQVTRREPPAIDGSRATATYFAARYPSDNGAEMVADADLAAVVDLLRDVRTRIDMLDERKAALESRIKAALGELSVLRGPAWHVTWKRTRDWVKTDWEAIATTALRRYSEEDRAALIGLHSMTMPGVRRFVLKEEKGS